MKRRCVIITADDFGLLPEVNDAVIAGYESGIVTSASLRVTATASHSATVAASMRPGLGVGLQLVLCDGVSTLPRRHIPNLVDGAGRFVDRPLEAAWLYRKRAGLREELKSEIRAQIEKFLATGLNLNFLSSHYHLHLHPTVLSVIKELAEEYPIHALRMPCSRLVPMDQRSGLPVVQAAAESRVLGMIVRWGGLRARSFVRPDRVEPLSLQRPATEHAVAARIKALPNGVTELVCRPGSMFHQFDGVGEAAVISSRIVREAITESGVDPISYRSLIEDF
ncbi:MAG TPA: ChbG/HpnK family deacetylase [Candidatus Limnocylindrales bacterium]|nr:ChbG/HpnK family deacetylase [Candidatus Limnocylindrales bacterium]